MAAANAAFSELGSRPYKEQAVWFLNGFWDTVVDVVELDDNHNVVSSKQMPLKDDAETVWKVCHKFTELDKKKEKGCELDEFGAHVLLEHFSMTLTVIAMREALRQIDVDSNGKMSLIEYLVFRYKRGVEETVNSPQGAENKEEIEHAQRALEQVQQSLTEMQEAIAAQEKAVADVSAAEEACRVAQAAVEAAEAEQEAAVRALHAEEEAYHGKIAALEAKVNDAALGVVSKNKAANELAQLKAEDPLPLARAKITSEAALRKVAKQRKEAVERTAECQTARLAAVKKQEELNAAAAELEEKMAAATAELEAIKKKGGAGMGNIWWMEREITEAEKYLPKSKQRNRGA